MDKWITLHVNGIDKIGKEVLVNFKLRLVIEFQNNMSYINPIKDYCFKESPAEILAMINKPDTELTISDRQREIVTNFIHALPDHELRQVARELIDALRTEEKENELLDADYYTVPVINARTKLEALLGEK